MASCEQPELKQQLYRYVRGELDDPATNEEMQQHVQECPDCRGVYRELEWMLGSLRKTSTEEHQQLLRELTNPPSSPLQDVVSGRRTASLWERIKRWLASGGGAN